MRILANFPVTLSASFVLDETPFDAGAVTVTVTDAAGATVSTGAATQTATGQYTYPLPAQSSLGPLTAQWVGTASITTYPEVVGGTLFQLADLRASDPAFADTTKWPTSMLAAARDAVTAEFARITGRSFLPRGNTYTTTIDTSGWVLLPDTDIRSIASATLDGTALDVSTLSVDRIGKVTGVPLPNGIDLNGIWDGSSSTLTPSPGVLVLNYLYGFQAVPEDVYRAALIRAHYVVSSIDTGIPDRATSYVAEQGGTFTLATAGAGPWQTGIPEVDAVLARYTIQSKGVSAA